MAKWAKVGESKAARRMMRGEDAVLAAEITSQKGRRGQAGKLLANPRKQRYDGIHHDQPPPRELVVIANTVIAKVFTITVRK